MMIRNLGTRPDAIDLDSAIIDKDHTTNKIVSIGDILTNSMHTTNLMSLVRRFATVPTIDRNKPTMCNHLYNVIVSTPTCHVITNSMSVICKLSIGTTAGP